jgi:hypothetical protein
LVQGDAEFDDFQKIKNAFRAKLKADGLTDDQIAAEIEGLTDKEMERRTAFEVVDFPKGEPSPPPSA